VNISNLIFVCCALCLNRSKAISTPDVNISTDNAIGDVSSGTMDDQTTKIQAHELSKDFVQWVNQGEAFWY